MPKLAIAWTIKNEARLVPGALAYHRALGVERFYVFLDGTTDAMRDWLPGQSDVVVCDTVVPGTIIDPPSWIGWAADNHAGWMDVRKNLNTWCARRSARADGFEWLAVIDPDELIVPEGGMERAVPLATWLDAIPARATQVFMPNLDALPTASDGAGPFDKRHFLARLGWIEFVWRWSRRVLSRIDRKPEHIAWFDHNWFRLTLGRRNPRVLIDPRDGRAIPFGYFLSYASQKSLIRTDGPDHLQPHIHFWKATSGGPAPRTVRSGNVLHFDTVDAPTFAAKFRQRMGQQEFEQKLFYARWKLGKMATELDEAALTRFFDECLSVRDPARLAELIAAGTVLESSRHIAMVQSG